MTYLLWVSFLAGLLTVLAPCVFSLLPVILGGTLGQKNLWRPLIIAASLGLSVFVFTLLLRSSTAFIGYEKFWQSISGFLIVFFGFTMLFPSIWETVNVQLKLYKSEELIGKSQGQGGVKGVVLLGAALGPVFTTCSPTYFFIVGLLIQEGDLSVGLLYLLSYILGLVLLLLIVGYGGQLITRRLRFASNPKGWFKRILGLILILIGLLIWTGYDKRLEAWLLDEGYLGDGLQELEESLLYGVE